MKLMNLTRGALVLVAGFCISPVLNAESPVREMRVQLASGFSPIQGRLITAGDTIIFVDDAQPQSSFFTSRAQIEQVNAGDKESVIIQFRQPIRDREGERMRLEFRVSPEDSDTLRTWFSQAAPGSATAERAKSVQSENFPTYSARRDKFIGGDNGRLVVRSDSLSFEADSPGASREWLFADIRELKQKGPYRLEIQPFSGDNYALELQGGGGMARDDFQRIADSIARARSKR
jgi:allophanate hydrolase subunit 2